MRSYVFSIQDTVSHGIGNPAWIYNRTNHFFHTKISSHYVLDNTICLLLLYSHTGLFNLLLSRFGFCNPRLFKSWDYLNLNFRWFFFLVFSCGHGNFSNKNKPRSTSYLKRNFCVQNLNMQVCYSFSQVFYTKDTLRHWRLSKSLK